MRKPRLGRKGTRCRKGLPANSSKADARLRAQASQPRGSTPWEGVYSVGGVLQLPW